MGDDLIEKTIIYIKHLFLMDSMLYGEITKETWNNLQELFPEHSEEELKEIFKNVKLCQVHRPFGKTELHFLKYNKNTGKYHI